MSLLSTAARLNTANQLESWNTSAMSAMQNAKGNFLSISTQLEAMRTNTDYTSEDIAEVESMLANLTSVAQSIITQ